MRMAARTPSRVSGRKPRVGFAIEQLLGHVAYTMNLREAFASGADFEPVWIEVPFRSTGAANWPLVRSNWAVRGSLIARRLIAEADSAAPLDALFVHTQSISLLSGAHMRRIPTVLSLDATPRNIDSLSAAYGHRVGAPAVEYVKRQVYRRVMRNAAGFTTWSHWAKDSLVSDYGVDAERVSVARPGVDLKKFPLRPAGDAARGVPLKLLFVGGDLERKGGDLLIDVARTHLSDTCELHLVTGAEVPPGPGVHVYRGLRPYSNELMALYRTCDVFVLPTTGDCLAVVLGEAMAASMPVITTRVGAHAEAVEDGWNGYLIDPGDGAALRDRIERLARDPALRSRMGAASRQRAEAEFDAAKSGAIIHNQLMSLVHAEATAPASTAMEGGAV